MADEMGYWMATYNGFYGVPNDPTAGLDLSQSDYPWWYEQPSYIPEDFQFADPWQEVPMSEDESSWWADVYPEDESSWWADVYPEDEADWMNAGLEASLPDLQASGEQIAYDAMLESMLADAGSGAYVDEFGDILTPPPAPSGGGSYVDEFGDTLTPPPAPVAAKPQSSDIFSQFANVARSVSSIFSGTPSAPAQSGMTVSSPQPGAAQTSGVSGLISSISAAVKSILPTTKPTTTPVAKPVAMSTATTLSSLGLSSGSGGLIVIVLVICAVVGVGFLFKGSK
jgi:hypothetical protein